MEENTKNEKIIVVGDVHGRSFWKDVIGRSEKIIFLGDYVDAYGDEGITPQQELENFQELVEFARTNKEHVILLIGNHDQQYILKGYGHAKTNRFSYTNASAYSKIFADNKDLFYPSYQIGDILFTHAGVAKDFQSLHYIEQDTPTQQLNTMFENNGEGFSEIGWRRGGWNDVGSITWSDFMEEKSKDWYQIFAHTQCYQQHPIITEHFAMVDARRPFLLDIITHNITEMNGDSIELTDVSGIQWC